MNDLQRCLLINITKIAQLFNSSGIFWQHNVCTVLYNKYAKALQAKLSHIYYGCKIIY